MEPVKLRVMAWNVGLGSRKKGFPPDADRAGKILRYVKEFQVDVIALQEMASRDYSIGLPSFNLSDFLNEEDNHLHSIHFEPGLSLPTRHSYPYGKLPKLNCQEGIVGQEQGLGVWVRSVNNWRLRNLYTDDDGYPALVEVQRPLPHPLYMGDEPAPRDKEDERAYSAGRDQEDRPVLWSRLDKLDGSLNHVKIYFISLHLPTLSGEDKEIPVKAFNDTQMNIALNVLGLSKCRIWRYTVEKLASDLRTYALRSIVAQAKRIKAYWKAQDERNTCVFIMAGDFNFYHCNEDLKDLRQEEIFLTSKGKGIVFKRAKSSGATRNKGGFLEGVWRERRIVDNIWVSGAKEVILKKGTGKMENISDHYPVIADIKLDVA